MGLLDDIRSDKAGRPIIRGTEALAIEQKLNSLFYAKPNLEEEVRFLGIKRGTDGDRYGLHASSIIASDKEFCYREQVLSLFYKQCQGENLDVGLKRVFSEGDSVHEKWQRLFIRGGIGAPEDMDRSRFRKRYDLSYTPDAIVTIGKKEYVVEIKSQNTFAFKKSESHPSGMKQLKFYMFLTKIYDGFVLVEDKNDQNFKILMAKYDATEMDGYVERLEKVQKYKGIFVEKRKMVPGICDSQYCKRACKCNMRDACFNMGMGRVRLDV